MFYLVWILGLLIGFGCFEYCWVADLNTFDYCGFVCINALFWLTLVRLLYFDVLCLAVCCCLFWLSFVFVSGCAGDFP